MKDFKVRCVKGDCPYFTKGKVYKIENGHFITNQGIKSFKSYNNVEEINESCCAKFELVPEPQKFTKDMLRTGDLVISRDGTFNKVILDPANVLLDVDECYLNISLLTDDLTVDSNHTLDIVEVLRPNRHYYSLSFDKSKHHLLWQRPEPRKINKSEAEKLLSEHLEELIQIEG
ncbi:hypothetical protein Cpap_1464 [Ruminiclostridium papyrosolvens DSM 2782]|uniref:Uncharacterized protein n=1 Tax=Ruminiclostridium papyrosolvens DSM 2782 TaxID=588581 RepID=F1TEA6_9FIRM|nr:hypothetical protein [Ruminiclostridium papyrosolvens]EGD47072.1 hypothetical protein Cpap_1464 [Ruminiclostridium papyrosolvens DSM 2782]WES36013.1 hypothetical protein P0092_08645 [Ruminiclostridium papyrosolvens DSM 2782]WES36111.1 hypothetical protein P0092_09145 [Ruminiclostridium papyrosolvens DSM 2782]